MRRNITGHQPLASTEKGPPPKGPSPVGRQDAQDKAQDIRDAVREANQVLKDLRTERKLFKDLLDSVKPDVQGLILDTVEKELEVFSTQVEKKTDEAVESIGKRFDTLEALLLGLPGSVKRPPLEEAIQSFKERNKI